MTEKYLHFTLGPVQGFVAQARRTRDFWAGSFILSWLSAVAMQAVKDQGGKIKIPKQDPNYLDYLTGTKSASGTDYSGPQQGSVPNRFKAEISQDFNANLVTSAVKQAWRGLAQTVWAMDKLDILAQFGNDTKSIWDDQIKDFWEISWCLADNNKDSNLLDRRKNWRTYFPPEQAGLKCMMMEGWQELSGAARPHGDGQTTLETFWSALRNSGAPAIKTDIQPGEHLCAIGYVKRRFVHCFHRLGPHIKGDATLGWTLHGWPLQTGVPSVTYLAAAPWLARAINAPNTKALLWRFHDHAFELSKEYGEWKSALRCVEEKSNAHKKWKALDGNVFFESALDNKRLWDETRYDAHAKNTKTALAALRKETKLAAISPFYAVLIMDGDSLGKQMSEPQKQEDITTALQNFTEKVAGIVEENSGFLVYAGGDDVLALLPLEHALPCALALRSHYEASFEQHKHISTSLSGAVIYAHIKIPLSRVLSDAHTVLDDIAKAHHGRDAIAVKVLKPGGEHLLWGMPWELAINKAHNKLTVETLADQFRNAEKSEPHFASKFFYRIHHYFELFKPRNADTAEAPAIGEAQIIDLLASEYVNSGKSGALNLKQARGDIKQLIAQSIYAKRKLSDNERPRPSSEWVKSTLPSPHAALLVRFLASKGIER